MCSVVSTFKTFIIPHCYICCLLIMLQLWSSITCCAWSTKSGKWIMLTLQIPSQLALMVFIGSMYRGAKLKEEYHNIQVQTIHPSQTNTQSQPAYTFHGFWTLSHASHGLHLKLWWHVVHKTATTTAWVSEQEYDDTQNMGFPTQHTHIHTHLWPLCLQHKSFSLCLTTHFCTHDGLLWTLTRERMQQSTGHA